MFLLYSLFTMQTNQQHGTHIFSWAVMAGTVYRQSLTMPGLFYNVNYVYIYVHIIRLGSDSTSCASTNICIYNEHCPL